MTVGRDFPAPPCLPSLLPPFPPSSPLPLFPPFPLSLVPSSVFPMSFSCPTRGGPGRARPPNAFGAFWAEISALFVNWRILLFQKIDKFPWGDLGASPPQLFGCWGNRPHRLHLVGAYMPDVRKFHPTCPLYNARIRTLKRAGVQRKFGSFSMSCMTKNLRYITVVIHVVFTYRLRHRQWKRLDCVRSLRRPKLHCANSPVLKFLFPRTARLPYRHCHLLLRTDCSMYVQYICVGDWQKLISYSVDCYGLQNICYRFRSFCTHILSTSLCIWCIYRAV